MGDILAPVDADHPALEVAWSALGKVFLLANWKGGVGKSTISSHLGGRAAAHGLRTLVVDLNGQGNIALDFGVFFDEAINDQGRSLWMALTAGEPLVPKRNVRPNLDIVPGGEFIPRIEGFLKNEMTDQARMQRAVLALARALVPLAGDYDLIVIDSPPENELLLTLCLCAARFVVAPMKTDEASRLALRQLARIFRSARRINRYLRLIGVALFATSSSARKVHAEIRTDVAEDFKAAVPVFNTFVRHAEALAFVARKQGLLYGELAAKGNGNPAYWRSLKQDPGRQVVAEHLDKDIAGLVEEIFSRAQEVRKNMIEKGEWP